MKKFKIILFICLIILTGASAYTYASNTYNHKNINSILIYDNETSSLSKLEFSKDSPFWGFDYKQAFEPNYFENHSSIILTVKNKYGFKKDFSVIDINKNGILINGDKSYILPHSDSLASMSIFSRYYKHVAPRDISIGESPINPSELIDYKYLTHDGVWNNYDFIEYNSLDLKEFHVTEREQTLHLSHDIENSIVLLKVMSLEDKSIIDERIIDDSALFIPEYNGKFIYELHFAIDGDVRGIIVYKFIVVNDFKVTIEIDNNVLEQGDFTVLRIKNADPRKSYEIANSPFKANLFKHNGDLIAYIGCNYRTSVGKHTLTVRASDNTDEWTVAIEVIPRDFHIQHLKVDPNVEASTRNEEAYAEYARIFTPVRKVSIDKDLTTGNYLLPTSGRLSTEYGENRYVNGAPTSYRHSGLDIAAPRGQKVVATISGKVVLSYNLILTGKTIVIDHGFGIFSTYLHLDSMSVSTGDLVKAGEKIGTVGSTGFSTGPHLHFTMSYYENSLEPGYFLGGSPITYENYKDRLK